jgi:hypothetical protein
VGDWVDDLAGLQPRERKRLEHFATAYERLDASQYAQFANAVESDAVDRAQTRALGLVGSGPRRVAVRAAVRAFVEEATQAYSRRMSLPDTFLLFQSLPDRAEDRVRFLGSVERAVVGLILWDDLDDDDRVALVGPWLTVAEPIA